MPNLTCAGCGSVYPLEGVKNRDFFPCAVCGQSIIVPIAGPSAARAAAMAAQPQAPQPMQGVAPVHLPPPIPAPPPPARRRPVVAPPRPGPSASRRERDAADAELAPWEMRPLAGLSIGVIALFVLMVVTLFVSAWTDWKRVEFLRDGRGRVLDQEVAARLDASAQQAAIAHLLAFVVLAALFIAWFHRAHANLRAAKVPGLQYGSGWAIGGFFVPVLNLARPAQIMGEIWKGTACVSGGTSALAWKRSTASPLAGWWWALYLVCGGCAWISFRLMASATDTSQLESALWASIVGDGIGVASALMGMELVRRVTSLQDWARTTRG